MTLTTTPQGSTGRALARRRRRRISRPILKWIYLAIGLVATLVPFIWMVSGSFRTEKDLYSNPASLIPRLPFLHGYTDVWSQLPFGRLFFNSVVFTFATTILTLFFDSMCAYALARIKFKGRNVVFIAIIATLMIPFQVTLVPMFDELYHFGWLNTYQGLIIPRATSAFGIFLFRQFFIDIPPELDEAARVDGANHWTIYTRVILPQAKPAIATVALMNGMNLWNDLLWPLVVSSSTEMQTLPAGLTLFGGQHVTDHAVLLAGSTMSMIPIAVLFFFLQKYFVAGISTTGLK